eukprot:TRINITY_DN24631_c0_g1_i1.p1 TRINITY_DN24631_c0_g1~~TRINITY_DN24631_c0_g1_i1.p1  ORF type:complete len:149 (+),score=7.57 TRINITY_DN24631_c0_g1_i1:63-509(+)
MLSFPKMAARVSLFRGTSVLCFTPSRSRGYPVEFSNVHPETKWFQMKEYLQETLSVDEVGFIRPDRNDSTKMVVFLPSEELATTAVEKIDGNMMNGSQLSAQHVAPRDREGKHVVCYACGKEGHINRDCPDRNSASPSRPTATYKSAV